MKKDSDLFWNYWVCVCVRACVVTLEWNMERGSMITHSQTRTYSYNRIWFSNKGSLEIKGQVEWEGLEVGKQQNNHSTKWTNKQDSLAVGYWGTEEDKEGLIVIDKKGKWFRKRVRDKERDDKRDRWEGKIRKKK